MKSVGGRGMRVERRYSRESGGELMVPEYRCTQERYCEDFEVFLECTTQKAELLGEVMTLVEELGLHGRFIDVGAGNGALTARIAPFFRETVAIEPSGPMRRRLAIRGGADVVVAERLEEHRRSYEADLVLCSHALFHIPPEEWLWCVRRMQGWLRPGGQLVLALQSPSSECMKMLGMFGYQVPSLLEFGRGLVGVEQDEGRSELGEVRHLGGAVRTGDLEKFLRVVEFQFNCLPHPRAIMRSEVLEYVEAELWRHGAFDLGCDQIFVRVAS